MPLSLGQCIELLHHVTAAVVIGIQLIVMILAISPLEGAGSPPGRAVWLTIERRARALTLFAALIAVGTGVLLARYTIVSPLLLISTPYGPLLVAKLTLTIVFITMMVAGPPAHSGPGGHSSPWARRLAVIRLTLALALFTTAYFMRYV